MKSDLDLRKHNPNNYLQEPIRNRGFGNTINKNKTYINETPIIQFIASWKCMCTGGIKCCQKGHYWCLYVVKNSFAVHGGIFLKGFVCSSKPCFSTLAVKTIKNGTDSARFCLYVLFFLCDNVFFFFSWGFFFKKCPLVLQTLLICSSNRR